jgi:hypothetical protein
LVHFDAAPNLKSLGLFYVSGKRRRSIKGRQSPFLTAASGNEDTEIWSVFARILCKMTQIPNGTLTCHLLLLSSMSDTFLDGRKKKKELDDALGIIKCNQPQESDMKRSQNRVDRCPPQL